MTRSSTTGVAIVAALLVTWGVARVATALSACSANDIITQDLADCPNNLMPCTIKKDFTIGNGCVLDFGARDVTLANLTTLTTGSGTVTFKAQNFTVGGGGFIDGRGTAAAPNDVGGFLIIQTTQAVSVLKQSTRIGRIDVSGNTTGGTIEFDAGGAVTISGQVNADSLTSTGGGGLIDLSAGQDITSFTGSTISAGGGAATFGEVDLAAGGHVHLGDTLNLNGVDGGTVNISSGTDTVLGAINAKGTGSGSSTNIEPGAGGDLCIEAGTQLQLQGAIHADGTGGGCGGCVDLAADFGDVTIAQPVSADAALPDQGGGGGLLTITAIGSINVQSGAAVTALSVGSMGFGGSLCLDASSGVNITTAAPLDASGGCGGCVVADARGSLVLNGGVNANGDAFGGTGGMVTLTSGDGGTGPLTLASIVDVSGGPCSAAAGCGAGGCASLEGCDVTVTAAGKLDARGPGGGGANLLIAHEQLTVNGGVLAITTSAAGVDGTNTAEYPSRKAPVIGAGLVQPAPLLMPMATCTSLQDPACLIPCPVCGNGVVEFPETCDNNAGTPLSCDGCSRFCQTENCNDHNACTVDSCDPQLGCFNLLQPPCPTSTPTATPSATPTVTSPPSHVVSGHVRYRGSALAVQGVDLHVNGSPTPAQTTDATGAFALNQPTGTTWTLRPEKHGGIGTPFSLLDAVTVLQASVGIVHADFSQTIGCDVSGNGAISALDAVLILQHQVGVIQTFPVTQTCGSDWVFVPMPASVMGTQQSTLPVIASMSCQPGMLTLGNLMSDAPNQDFAAVLLGDCNGSWQPTAGASTTLVSPTGLDGVLHAGRPRRLRGGRMGLPLALSAPVPLQALDVDFRYDVERARLLGVRRLGGARGGVMAVNAHEPGRVRLAVASPTAIVTGEPLVLLLFDTGSRDLGDTSLDSRGYAQHDR